MLPVEWIKSQADTWLALNTFDLDTCKSSGVYVIWHEGNPGRVVYIGQGDPISARLAAHRQDYRIQAYAPRTLRVTWASVPAAQRDGVERYLADRWSPLVGDVHPDVLPIAVNSPFG